MESLIALADRYELKIVEDCAEAFGTTIRGHHVGTFGQIGTFSFFGNKTITTGEGGAVITIDAQRAPRGAAAATYRHSMSHRREAGTEAKDARGHSVLTLPP